MKTEQSAPKSILVMPYAVTDWVFEALMPYMREKHGTRFVVLVTDNRTDSVMQKWCGPNDKVLGIETLEKSCEQGFGADMATEDAKAREIEDRFNITYMRDVIQQDRQLSSAFLSHAPWSPFHRMEIKQADDMTRQINGYMALTERLIDEEEIDMVLVWPVTAFAAAIVAVAEGLGVPVSYPYVSSRKGLLFWSSSAYSDDSQHHQAFENAPECDPVDRSEVVPPSSITSEIQGMDKKHSLLSVGGEIARLVFHKLEFFLLDLREMNFRKKRASMWPEIVQRCYKWWFYKRLGKISERNLASFDEKPFVYFSLALEPEFSVQARTKEFNDQAAIIRQIAMSLPAGYELVIKEHVLLGRRHLSFYKDLIKFPNIRMAHPSIRGIDLAAKARAVATLAGSVTLEATLLGKPVLEFSMHSVFSFLPNVTTVTSLCEMPSLIRDIVKARSQEEEDDIRRAGARVLNAIEDISFNGEGSQIFGKSTISLSDQDVARMASLLVSLFDAKKSGLQEKYATFA